VETVSLIIVAVAAIVVIVGVPMLRQTPRTPPAPEPLLTAVLDALPGGNCDACGNGSCFAAATAVQEGRESSTVCTTGGAATAVKVAHALRAHGRA
jgi:electron transport complex protein RnfB